MVEETCDKLMQLLNTRQYATFMHEVDELNPVDAAEFLTQLPEERLPAVFRLLKKDTAADVFAELDPEIQQKIITAMTDRELSGILEDLFVDDAVDMMEEMPASVVKRIMKNATPETRAEINRFLAYPEGSAGSVMTSEYVTLHAGMTVTEAAHHIRKTGYDKETVYSLFVTDNQRRLVGTLELRDLLFGDPDTPVSTISDANAAFVLTTDSRGHVADVIAKYDLLSVPVVDSERRLVGIVTVDDALDVVREEAAEDIEKMAAITPTDRPYSRTGVGEIFRKRIPWLLLLMISATFTGAIISHYEEALGAYVVLTSFIPMLMDTGGNAGGQASVTVIRGLSLGEIVPRRDALSILLKEVRVALLCGSVLAIVAAAKVLLVDRAGTVVAAVVALTLFFSVLTAKSVGSMLPLLARRLGLDPAVMASPFITTIVDAVSLMIYFRIATALLGI